MAVCGVTQHRVWLSAIVFMDSITADFNEGAQLNNKSPGAQRQLLHSVRSTQVFLAKTNQGKAQPDIFTSFFFFFY